VSKNRRRHYWLRSTEASDKHALETLRGGRTRPSQVWLGPRQKLHGENVCRMTTSISRIKTLRVYQRQPPCSCRAWPGVIDSDKGSIYLCLTFLLVKRCWRATLSSEHRALSTEHASSILSRIRSVTNFPSPSPSTTTKYSCLPGCCWSQSLGTAYVRKRRRLGGRSGSASETMRLAFVRNAGGCAYFNAC
jgi:hypothetical protein